MKYTTTKYTSDIKDVDNMDGFEFEEFCCELLRHNGYKNVRRTQASGDYGLDVIATKEGIVYGLQCKNYQGTVGIKAVQEAMSGSQFYSCHVPVVLTNSTFTKQAKEMANKTNVKLWDRNKLIALMKVFPKKEYVEKKVDYIPASIKYKNTTDVKEVKEFKISDIVYRIIGTAIIIIGAFLLFWFVLSPIFMWILDFLLWLFFCFLF